MKVTILFVTALAYLASAGPAGLSKRRPDDISSDSSSTRKLDARNLEKRVRPIGNCSREQWRIVFAALNKCVTMAQNAARSAMEDEFKMDDYFGSHDPRVRNHVKSVFQKIARGCAGDHSGAGVPDFAIGCWTHSHPDCFVEGHERNAGTYYNRLRTPRGPMTVLNICPGFFTMDVRSGQYELEDQPSLLIHEMSHVTAHTQDYHFYYSDHDFQIPTPWIPNHLKRNHADTYAYFAQAVEYQED